MRVRFGVFFVIWLLVGVVWLISMFIFFFFKQKTAYEMRISDWSSDVCSSDLFELEGERCKILAAEVVHPAETVAGATPGVTLDDTLKIGRASCRERVCQYV